MPEMENVSRYKRKIQRIFKGTCRQDFMLWFFVAKICCSEEKSSSCPICKTMNLLVITTHKSLTLGLNGSQKQPVDYYDNKIIDSENIQKLLYTAAVCKTCKYGKIKLIIFQDDPRIYGLKGFFNV